MHGLILDRAKFPLLLSHSIHSRLFRNGTYLTTFHCLEDVVVILRHVESSIGAPGDEYHDLTTSEFLYTHGVQ